MAQRNGPGNARGSILVSGASIAGPTVASWLARAGWDVTVVERFDHLRDEGQNVDVRGIGREVLRRMGLEDDVRDHHTTETAMAFVDADGRQYAAFAADVDGTDGSPTAELEILRGHLARVLHDDASRVAEHLFGDHVTALHDDGHGVDVDFAHGASRRFDAVVLAEGSRSRTRDLAFGSPPLHELGLFAAYLTIRRTEDDDRQWRIHLGGRGRLVHLRPDSVGTTRAMLSLETDLRGLEKLDHETVVPVLRASYADVGWEAPRILAALDDAPLYTDQVAQVRLPSWHRGRVVLLGDAAWCAGPFGTGTTSALAGAYVLAGEMSASPDDLPAAFARYERTLRPLTDRAMDFVPRRAHPRGEWHRRALRTGLRGLSAVNRIHSFVPPPPTDAIVLPDFGRAVAA